MNANKIEYKLDKAHEGIFEGRHAGGVRGKGWPVSLPPGQERIIRATFEAGVKPAAIARQFRLSRARVDRIVGTAQRGARRPAWSWSGPCAEWRSNAMQGPGPPRDASFRCGPGAVEPGRAGGTR